MKNEVRPLVVEGEEPVLIGRQTEEVVLLLDVLGPSAVIGAEAVDQVGLVLELLAADAVKAAVDVLVDVAVVVDPLEELLDEALMTLVRRADEEVVLDVDLLRQLTPVLLDHVVDERLGLAARFLGHAVDPRRIFVCSGQEKRLVAALAVMPDDDVRGNGRVRIADARRRVHVVDRRGQVEAHRGQ